MGPTSSGCARSPSSAACHRAVLPGSWARMCMHLLGIQRLAAFRADHNRIEQMPTFLVFVQQRAAALVKHMNIAPVHDGHEHGVKVEPLLREDVLVTFGAFLVGDTAEHTEPDQLSQASGKKVAGNPKTRLELIKATHAEKAFAQNQKCPAITNHSHRSRHGARLGFEFVPLHQLSTSNPSAR